VRRHLVTSLLATLVLAAPASAEVAHTVQPGETLWSIAAANNLTTRTVAAYNGLSEDAQVVLGSTIRVPTVAEGYSALQSAGMVPTAPAATAPAAGQGGGYTIQPGDTLSGIAASAGMSVADLAAVNGLDPAGIIVAGNSLAVPGGGSVASSGSAPAAPAVQGAYTVRPGDTLSGLAAGAGVSVADMAAMNGLDPEGILVAGSPLKLPSGAAAPAQAAAPAPAQFVPAADPAPTPTTVNSGDIQTVAAQYGVSPSLAAAIAWQESGFNNAMVSAANARGVMQVMPGTWDYVQQNLAQRPLDPSSASDNVHAGVMYLKQLLNQTGGDESAAIASYYQGLSSVHNRGMYDDTQRYVANVQALRSRFGG
jgi:LysM repeat protein